MLLHVSTQLARKDVLSRETFMNPCAGMPIGSGAMAAAGDRLHLWRDSAATTLSASKTLSKEAFPLTKGYVHERSSHRCRPPHEPGGHPRQHRLSRRSGRRGQDRRRADQGHSGDGRCAACQGRHRQDQDLAGDHLALRHEHLRRNEQGMGRLGAAGPHSGTRHRRGQAGRSGISRRDHHHRRHQRQRSRSSFLERRSSPALHFYVPRLACRRSAL